jgi:MFS family permease
MFIFYQPFALTLGIQHVRSFFVAYTAAALFARIGTGNLCDRVGRYRVSVASLTLYASVVSGMQVLRPGWLEVYGALFGLAHGLFFPAYSALTIERVPLRERAKLMALSNGAFSCGFALSGLVLGPIAEHGGYRQVFLVAGLASFASVGLLIVTESNGVLARARLG